MTANKRPFSPNRSKPVAEMTIAEELIQKGIEQSIEQGIKQGIEQGRLETQRGIARQLLKLHDALAVSELTGLAFEKVKALQEAVDSNKLVE